MYKSIIRPLFFLFSAETAHKLVVNVLRFSFSIPGIRKLVSKRYIVRSKSLKRKVAGIEFPNPVGLAAGFDKNAKYVNELASFGFGFIEIGTLTPKPQPGNNKPRLFRLIDDQALINRMGFNNLGITNAVKNLKTKNENIVVGGNIGKNTNTDAENMIDDYCDSFIQLYNHVDYFAINISCPNIGNLRELADKNLTFNLLSALQKINAEKGGKRPVFLKISPDLTTLELDEIITVVSETKIDGIIAVNTSSTRENLYSDTEKIKQIGQGGLSGKPLFEKSLSVVSYISEKTLNSLPVIAVGGISTPEDALKMIHAGASLVQIYTGFIYEGPAIVKKINKAIVNSLT